MGLGFEPKQGLKDPIYQVTAHLAEGGGSAERADKTASLLVSKKKHGADICGAAINFVGTGFPRVILVANEINKDDS